MPIDVVARCTSMLAAALALCAPCPDPVSAQDTPVDPSRSSATTPSPSGSPGATDPAALGAYSYDQPEDVHDRDPMEAFGIGLRVGAGIWTKRVFKSALSAAIDQVDQGLKDVPAAADLVPEGSDDIAVGTAATVIIAMPINLGGLVFFRLEPLVALGGLTAVGGYTGLGFNIHIKRVYVSLGLGALSNYLLDDRFDYAADIFFRVPVDVYWYANDGVGLFLELAGAGGASVAKPAGVNDAAFTKGLLFDASLGVRFP